MNSKVRKIRFMIVSIVAGLSLIVYSSDTIYGSEDRGRQYDLLSPELRNEAIICYNIGLAECERDNNDSALPFLVKASKKGHIPSKIKILDIRIEQNLNEIKIKQNQKNIISQNLHMNDVLASSVTLQELESKIYDLWERNDDIYLRIDELKNLQCSFLCDSKIKLYADRGYMFDDRKNNRKNNRKIIKIDIESKYKQSLECLDAYFEWRLNRNILNFETILELKQKLQSIAAKTSIDQLLIAMTKINQDHIDWIENIRNELQSNCNINYICEKILYEYNNEMTNLLYDSIAILMNPAYFVVNGFIKDLKQIDGVYSRIFIRESRFQRDDNYLDLVYMNMAKFFMIAHDNICRLGGNYANPEKLEMIMGTMHFANNTLQLVDSNDEDILTTYAQMDYSIKTIRGKYISWYMNQNYKIYAKLLCKGLEINYKLFEFYEFAQKAVDALGTKPFWDIFNAINNSNMFQIPISQEKQNIYVHRTHPYVIRLKICDINHPFDKDGNPTDVYTIGLIKNVYTINTDEFNCYNDSKLGKFYKRKFFCNPSICNESNEIMKFSFDRESGKLIPANFEHHNEGWKNRLQYTEKGNLMKCAHFKYQ